MFKDPNPLSAKRRRTRRRHQRDKVERSNKAEVRDRDRYCRFPVCGCVKANLAGHVSHQEHKGMGGNPAGDKSMPERMLFLCRCRHRESAVSIDRGTLRWNALTHAGAVGPIAWELDLRAVGRWPSTKPAEWFEVARENARHTYEEFTPLQKLILAELAAAVGIV